MTEMEEFVALLKYTAKSYLIFLLTASATATQQIEPNHPAKPAEEHLERKEDSKAYIQ